MRGTKGEVGRKRTNLTECVNRAPAEWSVGAPQALLEAGCCSSRFRPATYDFFLDLPEPDEVEGEEGGVLGVDALLDELEESDFAAAL